MKLFNRKNKKILPICALCALSLACVVGGATALQADAAVDNSEKVAYLKQEFLEFCVSDDENHSDYTSSIYAGEEKNGYNPVTVKRFLAATDADKNKTYVELLAELNRKAVSLNDGNPLKSGTLTDDGLAEVWEIFGVEKSVMMDKGGSIGTANVVDKFTGSFKATSANDVAVGAVDSTAGEFSVVVMGDQQSAVEYHSSYVAATYDYLRDNKDAMNLKAFVSVGDIVDDVDFIPWREASGNPNNDIIYNPGHLASWRSQLEFVAAQAKKLTDSGIPTALVMGNHDYNDMAESYRLKNSFNEYFPLSDFSSQPWFGGNRGTDIEASYYNFEGNGQKYSVMTLGTYPTDAMLTWANKVVAENSDRKFIIATHAYFYGEPMDLREDGMHIWDTFVSQHENIMMVVCGHECTESGEVIRRVDYGKNGNAVTQFMINPQNEEFGGAGIFSQLIFRTDGTVDFVYYSPFCNDEYGKGYYMDENQFTFSTEPASIQADKEKGVLVENVVASPSLTASYLSRKSIANSNVYAYYNVEQSVSGLQILGEDTYGYVVYKLNAGDFKSFNKMSAKAQGSFLGADGAYQLDFSFDGETYETVLYNNRETGYFERPFCLDTKVLGAQDLYVRLSLRNAKMVKLELVGDSVTTAYSEKEFTTRYQFANTENAFSNPSKFNTTTYGATHSYYAALSNGVLGMGASGMRTSKSSITYKFDAGAEGRFFTGFGFNAAFVATNLHAENWDYVYKYSVADGAAYDYDFGDYLTDEGEPEFGGREGDVLARAYISVDGKTWSLVDTVNNLALASENSIYSYYRNEIAVEKDDLAQYFAEGGLGYNATSVWVKFEYYGAGGSFAPCGIERVGFTGTYNKKLSVKETASESDFTYELGGGYFADEEGETPLREGFRFDGWYLDDKFEQMVNPTDYEGQTRTFYAKWTRTLYFITYVLDGGTNAERNPTSINVNGYLQLADATKEGMTFVGWYDADGNDYTEIQGKDVKEDLVLYAQYVEGEIASSGCSGTVSSTAGLAMGAVVLGCIVVLLKRKPHGTL